MNHLSGMRLMELALNGAATPVNGEATHLERCPECAALLAEERRLSSALAQLPRADVPDGFTAASLVRFRRASSMRYLRLLPWAVLLCLLVIVPMLALAFLRPEPILGPIAHALGGLAVIVRAGITVFGSMPSIGVVLAGILCSVALLSCGTLVGLARRAAPAKYRER